ncbi:hypothetical protein MMPV_000710, partial [Pyropia vietnamensis]
TRKHDDVWVFPKGGVKKIEKPRTAAVRETREEAGVTGVDGAKLGTFPVKTGIQKMFLLHVTAVLNTTAEGWLEADSRQRRWVDVASAEDFLSPEPSILAAAGARIRRRRPELMAVLDAAIGLLAAVPRGVSAEEAAAATRAAANEAAAEAAASTTASPAILRTPLSADGADAAVAAAAAAAASGDAAEWEAAEEAAAEAVTATTPHCCEVCIGAAGGCGGRGCTPSSRRVVLAPVAAAKKEGEREAGGLISVRSVGGTVHMPGVCVR